MNKGQILVIDNSAQIDTPSSYLIKPTKLLIENMLWKIITYNEPYVMKCTNVFELSVSLLRNSFGRGRWKKNEEKKVCFLPSHIDRNMWQKVGRCDMCEFIFELDVSIYDFIRFLKLPINRIFITQSFIKSITINSYQKYICGKCGVKIW